jgi:hypothetical protein
MPMIVSVSVDLRRFSDPQLRWLFRALLHRRAGVWESENLRTCPARSLSRSRVAAVNSAPCRITARCGASSTRVAGRDVLGFCGPAQAARVALMLARRWLTSASIARLTYLI